MSLRINHTAQKPAREDHGQTLLEDAAKVFGYRISISAHREWAKCESYPCRPCTDELSGQGLRGERELFQAWMAAGGCDASGFMYSAAFKDAFMEGYWRICRQYHGFCKGGSPKRWIPVPITELESEL